MGVLRSTKDTNTSRVKLTLGNVNQVQIESTNTAAMANSEKFCLRWNDFERNISSAFRDIRDEKEFFDVTIACEDEQLQAHKVILSACSPFFRSVLRRNQPANNQQGTLVLYLKGVTYRDMESVLNFMYHGEVNVAQDDLNSFLAVAEELRVKGLTQSTSGGSDASNTSTLPPKSSSLPSRRRPSEDPHHQAPSSNAPSSYSSSPSGAPPIKPPRPPPPPAPRAPVVAAQQAVVEEDDEIQEYVPVKSEPAAQQQEMYEDPSQGATAGGGMMMTTEDSMQYDESYGAYEEGYDEGAYYQEGGQKAGGGAGRNNWCEVCDKTVVNFRRHMRDVHNNTEVQCEVCQKVFKNENSCKKHMRVLHNVYQSV